MTVGRVAGFHQNSKSSNAQRSTSTVVPHVTLQSRPRALFFFWTPVYTSDTLRKVTILAQGTSIKRLEVESLISVTGLIFWKERIKNGTTLTPLPISLGLWRRRRVGVANLVNPGSPWGGIVAHGEVW